jgi:hypothetical protein
VTLTTYPHLVPRSRMSRSYTSSPPKHLHGVSWYSFSFFNVSIYTIPSCLFPFFWQYIIVSLFRSIPALLNFHFEH